MTDIDNVERENKSTEKEKCSSCGQEIASGDGRFRKPDQVICLECHKRSNKGENEGVSS